ncbi:MAG: leucyl/phenylalanyl-tRNA--protein transferase [Acidimicrobiaceae bacterium]|nr:leucyl/phenylalanyl-tRNA--protein transferase [Acidimicrobiaceae bacterium]
MPADARLDDCRWVFPDPSSSDEGGLVAVGADLEPATLLAAYSRGLFPMPLKPGGRIGWWSPPERGVLEPGGLIVHRSLRRACRRFEIRVDTAFAEIVDSCADPARPHGCIDAQMQAAYVQVHHAGFAHSVETWRDGEVGGGLYGVAIGGLFAGESMFYRTRDASKVALVALADGLGDGHPRLIDVQWATPHLRSLGVQAVPRRQYLHRLPDLLKSPLPDMLRSGG